MDVDREFAHDYRRARWWLGSYAVLSLLNMVVPHDNNYVWGPLLVFGFYLGRLDRVTQQVTW